MAFDPSTQTFRSLYPDINIPDNHTLYTFLFSPNPSDPFVPPAVTSKEPLLIAADSSATYTYAQAKQRADDISAAFYKEFGIGEGKDDVVVVFSGNDIEYGPVCWATHRVGAVVSPANPAYNAKELGYQVQLVSKHHPVKLLVISPVAIPVVSNVDFPKDRIILITGPSRDGYRSLDDLVAQWRGKVKDSDVPLLRLKKGEAKSKLAFLSFSSGTTGLPKAVSIPHSAPISNVLQIKSVTAQDHRFEKGDKALAVLPFFHIYGLVVILHYNFYNAIPIVIIRQFTLEHMLETIHRHRVAYLYLVPPQVVLMAKSPLTDKYDLKCMKFVMAGAAPLTDEIATAFKGKFPQVTSGQGYGMTETCTVITYPNPVQPISASGGILVPNIVCKVVSDQGKLCKPNERGELWCKSPSNALNYLGNKEATESTFDQEGFVHTGDEVYFDEKGDIYITDRIKELIKSKGFQVPPAELEGHLLGHDDVLDVGVIGLHDDYAGEVPKAFVVLTPSAKKIASKSKAAEEEMKKSIIKYVADHKVRYKHLDGGVEFIEAIPKTPSGKILRRMLRDLAKQSSPKAKL